jgi:hypothetical protein
MAMATVPGPAMTTIRIMTVARVTTRMKMTMTMVVVHSIAKMMMKTKIMGQPADVTTNMTRRTIMTVAAGMMRMTMTTMTTATTTMRTRMKANTMRKKRKTTMTIAVDAILRDAVKCHGATGVRAARVPAVNVPAVNVPAMKVLVVKVPVVKARAPEALVPTVRTRGHGHLSDRVRTHGVDRAETAEVRAGAGVRRVVTATAAAVPARHAAVLPRWIATKYAA